MKKPYFSILVPVYNVEFSLRQCIDSILMQSFSDFELILINDGSSDKSASICDEYVQKDNRIKVIHKENGGVSSARNAGLKISQGEYLLFCDSDDYLLDGALQTVYQTTSIKKFDLVNYGYIREQEDGSGDKVCALKNEILNKIDQNHIVKQAFAWLFSFNNFHVEVWTYAIKNEMIQRSGICFDENLKRGEDQTFMLHALVNANSVIRISECLYYYRANPVSLMHTSSCSYSTIYNSIFRLKGIHVLMRSKNISFSAYSYYFCKSITRVLLNPLIEQAKEKGVNRNKRKTYIMQIMKWYDCAMEENELKLPKGESLVNKFEVYLIRRSKIVFLDGYTRLLALYSRLR